MSGLGSSTDVVARPLDLMMVAIAEALGRAPNGEPRQSAGRPRGTHLALVSPLGVDPSHVADPDPGALSQVKRPDHHPRRVGSACRK